MAVARLTPSGALDTSFSGDGKQTVAFNLTSRFGFDEASAVAIDGQGRIVLAGSAQFSGQDSDMAVARLLANGTLDTSFGVGGKTTIAFDRVAGGFDVAFALRIDAFGRIVVVGSAQRNSAFDTDMAVTRLNANGTIDSTFGAGGRTTISFNSAARGNSSFATAVALDAQGRIVVGGSARFFSPDLDFALARLTSDTLLVGPGIGPVPIGGTVTFN
jgi:uncharacterized delta-60 repeat protein